MRHFLCFASGAQLLKRVQSDKKLRQHFYFFQPPFFVLFCLFVFFFLACLFIVQVVPTLKLYFYIFLKVLSFLRDRSNQGDQGNWAKDYMVITWPYTDRMSFRTTGIPMKDLGYSVSAVRLFGSGERGSTDLPHKTEFELKRGKSALEEITLKYWLKRSLQLWKKTFSRLTFHLNRWRRECWRLNRRRNRTLVK